MCMVSMIGDDWSRRDRWPNWPPQIPFPDKSPKSIPNIPDRISRKEFEDLKKQVEQMKRELEAAKKQDDEEGNSECEMEEKVVILKKIAEAMSVDLSEVFPND